MCCIYRWCIFVDVKEVGGELARMEGNVGWEQAIGVLEVCVYVCWGGYLECVANGLLTYHGGNSNYVWLTQDMGVDDVMQLVEETIREGLRERMLWYNTKYDWNMLMVLQRDGDIGKLIKGNVVYIYC